MNEKNVFDEILSIPTQQLISDMQDKFIATVKSVSQIQGNYGKSLKLELLTKDNRWINVMYRIPKAWTGKGQLDKLMASLNKLDLPLEEIEDKTFEWQRMELAGTMKGNPRHYPIRLVTEGKTE